MIDNISIAAIAISLFGYALNILALLIIPRNRKPTAGMAWLLIIFLLPYLGWVIFLILGTNKLPKTRRDAQQQFDVIVKQRTGDQSTAMIAQVPEKYQSVAKLATSLGHLPISTGDTTDYLTDYNDTIASIVNDVRAARTSVYIEYFILTIDDTTTDLFDALKDAVERGVEVRLLFDWFASKKYPGYKPMLTFLSENKIAHHSMLPLKLSVQDYQRIDLRNHRKLVAIDHKLGYVGSQNIIRRNYSRKDSIIYDELVIRMTGEVVLSLEAIFEHDWSIETHEPLRAVFADKHSIRPRNNSSLLQILPSGPSYNDEIISKYSRLRSTVPNMRYLSQIRISSRPNHYSRLL